MRLNLNTKKPQMKINVTFRENQKEEALYNWLKEKGEVGGMSNFIKVAMFELMEKDQKEKAD